MIKIAVSKFMLDQPAPKLPRDTDLWWSFNNSFTNEELFPEKLVELIANGYCITAPHQHIHTQKENGKLRAYRHKQHFVAGQHACLDFDNGDLGLDSLLSMPLIERYAYSINETPSSAEDARKWRVLFLFDRPIGNRAKYAETTSALPWRFRNASIDEAMKDPMRFYYGAKPGGTTHIIGNIMSLEEVGEALVLPYRQAMSEAKRIVGKPATVVNDRRAAAHLSTMMNTVASAQTGEKHNVLNRTAYTLGGYVAGGVFDYSTVISAMEQAIAANPNEVKSLKDANRTIEVAVKDGMLKALYYEEETRTVKAAAYTDGFKDGYAVGYAHAKASLPPMLPEKVGISSDLANYFGFRHRPRTTDEETGEITAEALVIEYVGEDGERTNAEYRVEDGAVEYATKTPALFQMDRERFGEPTLIVPDTLEATMMWANNQGGGYNIMGATNLPFHTGVMGLTGAESVAVLAWPGHPAVDDTIPRLDLPDKPSNVPDIDNLIRRQLH